ncbi:MAG TPA: hypothetical protein PK777_05815 [Thermoguttaceae bacterium]|jgi:hypothetical protein|nr:hypothetical protein [Thermoguttaceae bacterium]HPP52446.1 hypothetical protein [Thermoguttaceae bacterium]
MKKTTFRIVTRGSDGQVRIRDYDSPQPILRRHTQIGVEDCSTDLSLRGLPVFRGLIGPIPEGKNIIRYESPDVFEDLTKQWSAAPIPKRRRSRIRTDASHSAAASTGAVHSNPPALPSSRSSQSKEDSPIDAET